MKKVTKHSLWLSCLSIVLCVVMLTGTTLAWFTDNVTNKGNKIQSGTLDISLWEKQDGVYKDISASTTPLFDYDKWEPGFTASRDLQLQTAGTLALRYQVVFKGLDQMTASQTDLAKNLEVTLNSQKVGMLNDFASTTDAIMAGTLVPQENKTSADMAIQIHMPETLGNEYQGIALPDFDIVIDAAQYTYEEDDVIGSQYDAGAFPAFSLTAKVAAHTEGTATKIIDQPKLTVEIPAAVTAKQNIVAKVATAAPVVDTAAAITTVNMEISVKDSLGQDVPTDVAYNIGSGLRFVTVKHNGVAMDPTAYDYDDTTGILTIHCTEYSPYAVEFQTPAQYDEDVILVNSANVQSYLDGAHGSIDGKTIVLAAGNYGRLYLGRATKYADSNTQYYVSKTSGGLILEENEVTYEKLVETKNNTQVWSGTPGYVRNMSDVTIKAAAGAAVSVAGFEGGGGHIYGTCYDYVLDKAYTGGSAYYLAQNWSNITFKGLTFTAPSNIASSQAETLIDGVHFEDCSFTIGSTASGNYALRYYNENDNGGIKNLTVNHCSFTNCYQGIYSAHINGVSVTNSSFDTTGHNAVAVQDGKGPCNHGVVNITGNTFKNIGDRVIRFNDVGAGTQITIANNTRTDGGNSAEECMKATSLADGVTYDIHDNNWSGFKPAANELLREELVD